MPSARQRKTALAKARQLAESTRTHCGVTKRNGKPCKRDAGWGTGHPGNGRCKHHGGSTRTGDVEAAAEEALPHGMANVVPISPEAALEHVLRLTYGQLMYATAKVAQLTDEQTFKRYRNEMGQLSAEVPNKWIRLQRSLQQDLAKYSKMAIDAGILERQTRLAESQAGMVVTLIENVMSELGLTNAQRKRLGPAIRKNMDTIEGEARELPVAV